jgi:peptidoglycan hydrolase CwlO-like protein
MSLRTEQLKDRAEAKLRMLQAEIKELKAKGQEKSAEQIDRLETKLKSLKDSIASGWEDMTDDARAKLSSWLDKD